MRASITSSLRAGMLLSSLFFCVNSVYADATLIYKGSGGESSIKVGGGKVLFQGGGADGNAILYQEVDNTLTLLMHKKREYVDLDVLGSAMQNSRSHILKSQIQRMPSKDQDIMRQMMSKMLSEAEEADKSALPPTAKLTDERDTVLGKACKRAKISGLKGVQEICLADADALGLSAVDANSLVKGMTKMSNLGNQMNKYIAAGKQPPVLPDGLAGIPAKVYGDYSSTLESVSTETIEVGVLAIPQAYRQMQMIKDAVSSQ